ncbi:MULTISPECIES: monovalent cation/H(+) antiporter subunit G [Bacillus]|uniref:Na+/H+ antiporter subunit G n=1 Tax=Bacillus glycinifermentans TaxID=1664069 RepID=A0AAJ4D4Z5_9BACI|nr:MULTISPECIES: monovalent cation/H(+) antiporter subunit G [Bacillus]KKB72877.1 cation:proton antiporter [Bacillus sp. TH008]MBU8785310.1 monovalent cation/H(+) antiporter subunit G [Bacillus glycinifermentans]MDU0072759.1 monovalent cation/H(+) antiporter subunit G [Bacillus sp. IG6]MED8020553.1 monovalent cation/H(+) antiporter subunit G [Bacillus glycinifermentans]NUJ19070.1 Na+/H+ antiporter subunit G [Bacillus glycinifermentans]
MIEAAKIVIAVFILLGALISLAASFGTLRLPDVYSRIHAASKGATLGIISVLLGVFFYFWFLHGIIAAKVLLGIVFVFLTSPVGAHLIARAAYNSGVKMEEKSVQDDYEGYRNFVIKKKEDSYL